MEAGSNFSNYKPIIKSPKFTKYDSKKLSQAHSGNKPYQKNSDRNHEKGTNRESSLVDVQTTQYYQRVLTMLSKDFEDQEEREVFITNIVNELKENVFKVAQTKIGGTLLEKVLPYLAIDSFCDLLEGLSKDWEVVCTSKSASFVVQAFVKLARHHLLDEAVNVAADVKMSPEELKTQQDRLLNLICKSLVTYLTSNLAYHMQHACVSHVLRGLLELLSTRKLKENVIFGRKKTSFKQDAQQLKLDLLYQREVKKKHKRRMQEGLVAVASLVVALPKLQDHALNTFSGPVIQVLLECLADVSGSDSKELMDKLITSLKLLKNEEEEEDDDDDNDGNDNDDDEKNLKLSPLLLHPSGSRMVESILKHSSDDTFQRLFNKLFKGHMLTLATNHLGNYVLQALVQSVRTPEQFQVIHGELQEQLESLLSLRQTPLIVKLLSSSASLHTCQQSLLQDLLACFHCEDRKEFFARLLLMMVTYEMLCQECTKADEKTPLGSQEQKENEKEDDNDEKEEGEEKKDKKKKVKKIKKKEEEEKKEDKEEEEEVGRGSREEKGEGGWRELQSIDMHGSMMVQELLRMDDPGVLLQSLRHFSMSEKIFLASHCSGCRVVEALMVSATVPEEEKRWWLKTFKNNYMELACNKFGSRTFDALWNFASEKRKNIIRKELKKNTEKLRSDKFGYFVYMKCGFNVRKRKNEVNSSTNNKNKKKK